MFYSVLFHVSISMYVRFALLQLFSITREIKATLSNQESGIRGTLKFRGVFGFRNFKRPPSPVHR